MEELVRHRIGMFVAMGREIEDEPAFAESCTRWLREAMVSELYRAWVVEDDNNRIAASGGIALLPWPPSPRNVSGTLPIVFSMYTAPAHRRRGLARMLMQAIHEWCQAAGLPVVGLAASQDGQPLYETLGYTVSYTPWMFKEW